MHSVVIKTCSADDLLKSLGDDIGEELLLGASMVHADPPWSYSNTGTNGAAGHNARRRQRYSQQEQGGKTPARRQKE